MSYIKPIRHKIRRKYMHEKIYTQNLYIKFIKNITIKNGRSDELILRKLNITYVIKENWTTRLLLTHGIKNKTM